VSNDSEHNQVERQGFAIQPQVFSPDIVERVSDEILKSPSHRSRAGVRHAMHLASVREVASCSELMTMACNVLGPQAFPFRATIFDKSQDANWLVAWHQDKALPLRHRLEASGWGPWSTKEGIPYAHAPADVLSQVVALRIHLDDSTADSGPLKVLPGTHSLGVLDDDRIHQLSEHIAAVECVVPRGGVVAMRPLLVHASSKSRSEIPRRVLHIEYAASDSIASPLELEVVQICDFASQLQAISWPACPFAYWPPPCRACRDILDCNAARGRTPRDVDSAKRRSVSSAVPVRIR
jgi:hypothetical protein